jgi:hypothetical protein
VSEFDSAISLSDLGGYDDAPAGVAVARRMPDAGTDLGSLIQISMTFEQGAASLGD